MSQEETQGNRPLPHTAQIRKNKALFVARRLFLVGAWTKDNEKELQLILQAARSRDTKMTNESIRDLRSRRKSPYLKLMFTLKRGPYIESGFLRGDDAHCYFSSSEDPTPTDTFTGAFRTALFDLRRRINHDRNALRVEKSRQGALGKQVGKVYVATGGAAIAKKKKLHKALKDNKKPLTKEKHVGLELEFCSVHSKEELADILYESPYFDKLSLKTDGSLRVSKKSHHSHELCILATEDQVKEVVFDITRRLIKNGCYVNKTCGLHVHLDMRHREVEDCYKSLVNSLNVLVKLVPPSRVEHKDSYCKKNCPETSFEDQEDDDSTKYLAVNPLAYKEHTTLEVRLHSGTLSYKKICNWVDLLIAIVNKPPGLRFKRMSSLAKYYDLPANLVHYMLQRSLQFSSEEDDSEKEHIKEVTESRGAGDAYDNRDYSNNKEKCFCDQCLSLTRKTLLNLEYIPTDHLYQEELQGAA